MASLSSCVYMGGMQYIPEAWTNGMQRLEKSRLRPYSSHLWAVEPASQFKWQPQFLEGLAAILLYLGPWDGVLIGLIPRRCVFPSASCWRQHLLCLRE